MHLQTMPFKTAELPEHCIASLTGVRLGTHMLVHVPFEGTLVQEICKALFTLESLLPCVAHHVPPE